MDKMVNGKIYKCSPKEQEEIKLRALKYEEKKKREQQEQLDKQQKIISIKEKLNLNDDELNLLRDKKWIF